MFCLHVDGDGDGDGDDHDDDGYLHETGEHGSAAKEKAEGDDDVGEETEDKHDDVRLPPIAGLDHLEDCFQNFPFLGI